MEKIRGTTAKDRAQTDARLGAERAYNDAIIAGESHRDVDDLIASERVVADAQLLKFREAADLTLARERTASSPQELTAAERRHADDRKHVEREVTDALLAHERLRIDAVVAVERREHEAAGQRTARHRQDTDDELSVERRAGDVTITTLGDTTKALAQSVALRARHGDVFAMVAHDLRNPLCVIAINAQSIAEATKDEPTRQHALEVTRAASGMGRLLADLLDVARIDSGTLRIVKRPHDVCALVGEVHRTYMPLFAARHLTFTVKVPASPVIASFDHDRVVQVLSNLLGNAMKFTPALGTVELIVERRAEAVEVVLRDDGPGIRSSALPDVFKRFSQFDSDTRRGIGLGLYICENIIKAHGGRIEVESEFGKGATFRFTLPNAVAGPSTAP